MPKYDHKKNSETIMMALKKGKFAFENQEVNFDMVSVYESIVNEQIWTILILINTISL